MDSGLGRLLVVFVACSIGVVLNFNATLFSGFEWIQGGLIDSRLTNFLLEHSYRWLLQHPSHLEFFNPPSFYPTAYLSKQSDLLLGVAPFFWFWRALGFEPDTAYQLWMITIAILNFSCCYILLNRYFRLGTLASSFGSLVFAFGTAQTNRVIHQQLIPQFYVLVSIMALFVIFRPGATTRNRRVAIFVFSFAWVAQFYTSVNTYLILGLPVAGALIWALILPAWRRALLRLVRNHYLCIVTAALVAAVLLWPALASYWSRVETLGWNQPYAKPKVYIWFLTGAGNFLWGWIREGPFAYLRGGQYSQGIGFFTWILAAIGLIRVIRRPSVKIMMVGIVTTVFLTIYLTDTISVFGFLREIIPGLNAIRAWGRIGMIQLIPAAVGLGFFFQRLIHDRKKVALVIFMAVCLLEQVHVSTQFMSKQLLRDEVDKLASQVKPASLAFLLVPSRLPYGDMQEIGLWTTLASGKPTLNGRRLNYLLFRPEVDYDHVERYLEYWGKKHNLDPKRVQLIVAEPHGKLK